MNTNQKQDCSLKQKLSLCNIVFGSWGGAIILALTLFWLTDYLMPITYTYIASDDRFLASYLAGYWSGIPESSLPFINPIFSRFVSGLYTAFPGIHWYPNLHVASLFLSYALITRCIFTVAQNNRIHWIFPLAISIAIYFIAFCYNVTWLSFTLTPALACAGAAAVILCGTFKNRYWYIDIVLSIILIFVAYIWRSSSAQAGLCFCAGAVVYRALHIWNYEEIDRKRVSCILSAFVMTVGILICVSEATMSKHINDPELADYYAFRKACTQYLDYPGAINYEDDPELYEYLGISENLEQLAKCWFFMDKAITADTFNTLAQVDNPDNIESFMDTHVSSREAMMIGLNLFKGDRNARLMLYACILTFSLGFLIFLQNVQENRIDFFMFSCFTVGSFILCFYLCLLGRFPIRTFSVVAYVYLTVSVLLCGKMYGCSAKKMSVFLKNWCVLIVVMLLCSGIKTAMNVYSHSEQQKKELCIEQATSVETLAAENPENIYIFDFLLAMCNVAYPDYNNGLPTNLFYWGGSYFGTKGFTRQMKINDIEEFDAELFMQDNVYFVTAVKRAECDILWSFLREKYGDVSCTRVNDYAQGTVAVVKFS